MTKTANKKIIKYTSLALAISLAFPAGVLATSTENPTPSLITTSSETEKPLYETELKASIGEDRKSLKLETIFTKNTQIMENPFLYIKLPPTSNITNVEVVENQFVKKENVQTRDLDGEKFLEVRLADAPISNLELKADIKEGSINNFLFDIMIAGPESGFKQLNRINLELVNKDDTIKVEKASHPYTSPVLAGKFVSENANDIEWTEYIINPTTTDYTTDYKFNLNPHHTAAGQEISITPYELREGGLHAGETKMYAFGNIQNLTVKPYNIVKISFKTLANADSNIFTINDAKVERPKTETTTDSNTDKNSEAEALIKGLNEGTEKIEKELIAIEQGAQSPTTTTTNTDSQSPFLANIYTKEKYQALNDAQKGELELLDLNKDGIITDEEINQSLNYKAPIADDSWLYPFTDKGISKEALTKIFGKPSTNNQPQVQTPPTTTTVDALPITTIVLNDGNTTGSLNQGSADLDKLIADINGANKEILQVLKDQGIVSPLVSNNPAKVDIPQTPTEISQLVADINNANKEIDELAEEIYGKEAYELAQAAFKNQGKTDVTSLIKDLSETNKDLTNIIKDLNLTEARAQVAGNKEATDKLNEVIRGLAQLEANSRKAIDTVENIKAVPVSQELPHTVTINPNVDGLLTGLSPEQIKNLGDISTVTLDPLMPSTNGENRNGLSMIFKLLSGFNQRNNQDSK